MMNTLYQVIARRRTGGETEKNQTSQKTKKETKFISELEGDRFIPIGKIVNVIENHMCCARCAEVQRTVELKDFVSFCKRYEDYIAEEE